MKDYNIKGEVDRVSLGCMDDETVPIVTIGEIDGRCFCNLNAEQREKIFSFIHSISVQVNEMRTIRPRYAILMFIVFFIFGAVLSYYTGYNWLVPRPEGLNLYEAIM